MPDAVGDVPAEAAGAAPADPAPACPAPLRRLRLSRRSLVTVFAVMLLGLGARAALLGSADVVVLASGAMVLAGLLHPLARLLGRHLPRPLALLTTLLVVAAVVGGVVASVVGEVQDQTDRLKRILPEAALRLETTSTSALARAAREFGLADRVREALDALPGRLTGGSGADAVTANAGRGVAVLAGLVLTIFLLIYGARITDAAPRFVRRPAVQDRVRQVAAGAYDRAWRYAWVRLGVAVGSGLIGFALAGAFDLPGGVVLGAVMGLGSLVPGVGIVVAGLPLVLVAAGLRGQGIAMLLLLVAVQVAETVVVQRRLTRRVLRVGPAPTLLGALVGFEAGGLGVALLAVAVVVMVAAVLAELAPEPEPVPGPVAPRVEHLGPAARFSAPPPPEPG